MIDVNYQDLLNISKKYFNYEVTFLVIIIISILILSFKEYYDTLSIDAVVNGDLLLISVNYEDVKYIKDSKYILINGEKINFEIISFGQLKPYTENEIYQDVTLKLDEKLLENETINLKFYYNKDKAIKKILEKIF